MNENVNKWMKSSWIEESEFKGRNSGRRLRFMSYDPRENDWSPVNDQRKCIVHKKQKDPCLMGFFSYFNLSKFFNYHISSILDFFFTF